MITAQEARDNRYNAKQEHKLIEAYLTIADSLITQHSKEGKKRCTMEWKKERHHIVWTAVVQILIDNGFKVKNVPCSHYYEYGAIDIIWED